MSAAEYRKGYNDGVSVRKIGDWLYGDRRDFDLVAEFTIVGEPISKSRARFTKRGSSTFAYTPEKTKTGERMVAAAYCEVAGILPPDSEHQFAVEATFINGTRQRRDVDNMLKLVLDGLNGIAWADDNQVTEVTGRKRLGDRTTARTIVRIWKLDAVERRLVKCEMCDKEFDWFPSQAGRRFCSSDCHYRWRRERRMRTCENCGKEFEGHSPNVTPKCCSAACAYEMQRATVECTGCGVQFTKQRCHVKATNYCTSECQTLAYKGRVLKRTSGTCTTCGGPTSKKSYTNCMACHRVGVSGKPKREA